MILKVYFIILAYFLVGVTGFCFINRKKEKSQALKSWKKTFTYFIVINIVALSIVIKPIAFRVLAVIIIVAGFLELIDLFRTAGYKKRILFLTAILIFILISAGFFCFSKVEQELIFYTFAITSIFDSFSQITGELTGRKKLIPGISPNKTTEGFIGGVFIAAASGVILKGLIGIPSGKALILACGIAFFAFLGDMAASFYKRNFGVKDFNNLIPENGGFLDRFDSLLASGFLTAVLSLLKFV
ncbi:MAG: phosphatidate cytidylyltransferase [Bacteroidales bacterium]|nr:phosphatidate cytidylyltransferase [Bacteroidales bacterium]